MLCRDADGTKEPRVLLCIVSLSCSAVMKCLAVSKSPRCLSIPFLTSRRRSLASATVAHYATLCFQEGAGMEKSARGRGQSAQERQERRRRRQTGNEILYRGLSVRLLHSSFPFLSHASSVPSTKVTARTRQPDVPGWPSLHSQS